MVRYPKHPPARVALFFLRLRRTRPSAATDVVARLRLRTRSIARSLSRTIATCSKSPRFLSLWPPALSETEPALAGEPPSLCDGARAAALVPVPEVALRSRPTKRRQPSAPTEGRTKREAASPAQSHELRSYCGVAAFGRAAKPDKAGGLMRCRASTFLARAASSTPSTRRRGGSRGLSYRTRVRYRVS